MSRERPATDLFWDVVDPATSETGSNEAAPSVADTSSSAEDTDAPRPRLSLFEEIISSFPPVLESILAHLPTLSVFTLYHTSPYLRLFLQSYPLAWRTLSFLSFADKRSVSGTKWFSVVATLHLLPKPSIRTL